MPNLIEPGTKYFMGGALKKVHLENIYPKEVNLVQTPKDIIFTYLMHVHGHIEF